MPRCTNVYVHLSTSNILHRPTIARVMQHFALLDVLTQLPPTNEVWGKVIFSQASACPQTVTPRTETPLNRYPQDRAPPGQRSPRGPPGQRETTPRLYGKERAVGILLECILVFSWVFIRGSRFESKLHLSSKVNLTKSVHWRIEVWGHTRVLSFFTQFWQKSCALNSRVSGPFPSGKFWIRQCSDACQCMKLRNN